MKFDLVNGGIVMTENCTFYDVYMLVIDTDEKTIDVSDEDGFMIGMIYYDNTLDVSLHEYDSTRRFTGDIVDVIRKGELVL